MAQGYLSVIVLLLFFVGCDRNFFRYPETPIYNMTQPQDILCITWGEVLDRAKKMFFDNPFEWILWYPGGNIRTNRLIHNICVFLFHIIPAYFIDFLLLIFGQRRL